MPEPAVPSVSGNFFGKAWFRSELLYHCLNESALAITGSLGCQSVLMAVGLPASAGCPTLSLKTGLPSTPSVVSTKPRRTTSPMNFISKSGLDGKSGLDSRKSRYITSSTLPQSGESDIPVEPGSVLIDALPELPTFKP